MVAVFRWGKFRVDLWEFFLFLFSLLLEIWKLDIGVLYLFVPRKKLYP